MSGPVDVLAVMDDRVQQGLARADHRRGKAEPLGVIELRQARAAVAELIEAAPALSDYLAGYLDWQREQCGDPAGLDIAEADIARFRAALARCRGEA